MTVLSYRPHQRYSHAAFRTHVGDPEPRLEELLDDPIMQALMTRDRVTRPELDRLIARARRRLGPGDASPYRGLEVELMLDYR